MISHHTLTCYNEAPAASPERWVCPGCEEPNKAERPECNNCGRRRPGAKDNTNDNNDDNNNDDYNDITDSHTVNNNDNANDNDNANSCIMIV